jgi:hypothetical protein
MKRSKKKENCQHCTSRRQFLAHLGVAGAYLGTLDPVRVLYQSLVDGLISKAQAAEGLTTPRNYVGIFFPGGPTRWIWDGFLTPNGNDAFMRNRSVNNRLTVNSYSGDNSAAEHVSEAVNLPSGKVIHLPPLWNRDIPTVGGGWVAMNSLLSNALIMRGVHMQVDIGHLEGPARVPRPSVAGPSLSGLVADASTAPIPAIGLAPHDYSKNLSEPKLGGFKSERGTGVTLVTGLGRDALSKILDPFRNTDTNVQANATKLKQMQQSAIRAAMTELGSYAKSAKPGADSLYRSHDRALQLFERSFGDLQAQMTALTAKYTDLERRCAAAIPNIIPATGTGAYNIALVPNTIGLASQFAVAEFLLKNGLSSSIVMTGPGSVSFAGLQNFNDEHDAPDRQASLICHSYQFRVLAALIHELRNALGPSLWTETVVHVSAEYDRSPRDDMGGSDHAPESNSMSLFSGAIKEPLFIGNIKVDGRPGGTYKGTWGAAAPVLTDAGTRTITNEAAAASIASLLRVKPPVRSDSVISISDSGVHSLAEKPKNV